MNIYYTQNEQLVTLSIVVDDDSYRYRVIKGDNSLTLNFALSYALKLPLGSWCTFEGERYELKKPKNFTMNHTESYEYTLEMFSDDWNMRRYTVRNMVDKRLKFTITYQPQEHLQLLVDNMNAREGAGKWRVGNCIEGVEKAISLSFTKCSDYLNMIVDTYETEFESTPYLMSNGDIGHDIHLGKVEYNKSNPLTLSYGKGNGLRSGVGRVNVDDGQAVGVLCVQGGSTNIDSSKYTRWNGSGYEASSDLHLPAGQTLRYDGSYFEGEDGFDSTIAHTYIVDDYGLSISSDADNLSTYEDSLNGEAYYPQREEVITSVEIVDGSGDVIEPTSDMVSGQDYWVDIIASAIPASLDYSACKIAGETATVIMQSGMLSGKEINIETSTNGAMIGYVHSERRFKLVSQEIDGMIMPNATAYSGGYMPKVGDRFKVFHISLPAAYYGDNTTKTGAEWDLFRESIKYLAERLSSRYNYTGVVDGLWSKNDWVNIGGKLCLGGYTKFTHDEYEPDGVRIRIIGIKDYINNPHSPEVELSNAPVGAGNGIGSELKKIPSNEVKAESEVSNLKQYTKRGFADAKQTASMLIDAKLDGFTESVSPTTIRTMQAIVGDESLQFYFVSTATSTTRIEHREYYEPATKQFKCDAGIMQHKTLGITILSSSHAADEYKTWSVEQYTSAVLTSADVPYYLYVKASKTAATAVFLLSETAVAMEEEDGYYHFLTGILNSEIGGSRSYTSLYSFTLIEPGRMVIDRIQSSNFDMEAFEGMLIDLIGKRIVIGGDAELIVRSLTLKPPVGGDIDAYTAIDTSTKNIDYINSDSTFSINEKLTMRTEWEGISGRSDVDHTPSEAGATGSYMIAVTAANEVLEGSTTTETVEMETITAISKENTGSSGSAYWSQDGATYSSPSGLTDEYGYSYMRLTFEANTETEVSIEYTVSSEAFLDFLAIGAVDRDNSESEWMDYASSGYATGTTSNGVYFASGVATGSITRTIPSGTSYIDVWFSKDESMSGGDDQATITLSYDAYAEVDVEVHTPHELIVDLTAAYQDLLDLFQTDQVLILHEGNVVMLMDDGSAVVQSRDGLALYVDTNTAFTRSELSGALSAYYAAESAAISATTEVLAADRAIAPSAAAAERQTIATMFGSSDITMEEFESIKARWEEAGLYLYVTDTASGEQLVLMNNAYIRNLNSDHIDADTLTVKRVEATNTEGTVTTKIDGETGKLTAKGAAIEDLTVNNGIFNGVEVRGSVYAAAGEIGGLTLGPKALSGDPSDPTNLSSILMGANYIESVYMSESGTIAWTELFGGLTAFATGSRVTVRLISGLLPASTMLYFALESNVQVTLKPEAYCDIYYSGAQYSSNGSGLILTRAGLYVMAYFKDQDDFFITSL